MSPVQGWGPSLWPHIVLPTGRRNSQPGVELTGWGELKDGRVHTAGERRNERAFLWGGNVKRDANGKSMWGLAGSAGVCGLHPEYQGTLRRHLAEGTNDQISILEKIYSCSMEQVARPSAKKKIQGLKRVSNAESSLARVELNLPVEPGHGAFWKGLGGWLGAWVATLGER